MKKTILSQSACLMLASLCFFLVLTSCKKKEVKTSTVKLVNVQVRKVEQKPIRPYIQAIGTLDAYEEVTVSSELDGTVKGVAVDEGSLVSRGMVLASIDDTDYGLELKRAQAALKQAQATHANTRLEFKRKEALYKEELVTKQQYDDVETRLALADSDVDRARATLAQAETKYARTKVRSPMACCVKEKRVSAGDYVKIGAPLFVIIQSNPLKLHFSVPEKDVGMLKNGQEVTLKVDAFPQKEFKGKVSIIYPNLDDKTRTLKIEALVPNPDGMLKPGLFAKVTVYTSMPRDTLLIPITSLLYEADKVRVFVIEGDTAREREVKIGYKYDEMMEVVAGLKAGESVVVAGQQNLSEGLRVAVRQTAQSEQNRSTQR